MDDNKKKVLVIVGLVLALGIAAFSVTKSSVTEQGKAVGSLEEGINKENGLPLNPPPNDPGGAQPAQTSPGGTPGGTNDLGAN